MSLTAHDALSEKTSTAQSDDGSRLEQAQERFRLALERVEAVLADKLARPAVTSSEDSEMISVLREEIEDLRQNNSALNEANKTALNQVEMTIGRLKGLVES